MLAKHERYHGLGMDALVTVCSRNTNVIMINPKPRTLNPTPITLAIEELTLRSHHNKEAM